MPYFEMSFQDDTPRIDINHMVRMDMIQPYARYSWHQDYDFQNDEYDDGFYITGTESYPDGTIRLDFTIIADGEVWQQSVNIQAKKRSVRNGGIWYSCICPVTGKSCRLLFFSPKYGTYTHRSATGLKYHSQTKSDTRLKTARLLVSLCEMEELQHKIIQLDASTSTMMKQLFRTSRASQN